MVRPRQRLLSLPVAGAKTCHRTLLARACVLQSPIPLLIPLASVACRAGEGLAAAALHGPDRADFRDRFAASVRARCAVDFLAGKPRETCPGYRVLRALARPLFGHRSGLGMRPAATRSSASAPPPCGL